MADHFYLSIWVTEQGETKMFERFALMLDAFPFSKSKGLVRGLRVYAVDWSEHPALEEDFPEGMDPATTLQLANEFLHADSAYQVDVYMDLWEFRKNGGPGGWHEVPHAVTLTCYGPEFEGKRDDRGDFEVDFGLDTPFRADQLMPDPGARAMVQDYREKLQENIRRLLDYVRAITERLPSERKMLWTESGENFAEMIKQSFR